MTPEMVMPRLKVISQSLEQNAQREGLFVGVLGYEQRASYVASHMVEHHTRVLMCQYGDIDQFSYQANMQSAHKSGWRLVKPGDLSSSISKVINEVVSGDTMLGIGIDISAMRRTTIAEILLLILRSAYI
jgi:hypothetical protein